jgi:hypothetical protein
MVLTGAQTSCRADVVTNEGKIKKNQLGQSVHKDHVVSSFRQRQSVTF